MGDAKRRKASGNYPDTTKPKPAALGAKSDGGGETFTWEVLGDLAAHPKSDAVIQLLEQLKRKHEGSGGNTMLVTLEQPAAGWPQAVPPVPACGPWLALQASWACRGRIARSIGQPLLSPLLGPLQGVEPPKLSL